MVARLEVHTSLAPIITVRYCTPWPAAVVAWASSAAIFAPVLASL